LSGMRAQAGIHETGGSVAFFRWQADVSRRF
jgi:hypothetical protein